MPKDVKWCASCGEGTVKADRADCKKCGATKFVTSKDKVPAKKKGLKDKGKDKLAEREANNKLKIRSQVMEAPGSVTAATDDDPVATDIPMDVKFLPLEGWMEGQKDEEDSGKGATQKKLEAKARASMLSKVHSSITKKIMVTLLEISSKIMESCEPGMRAGADDAGVVVNAFNGVLLSYYFGQNNKKKFVYLRRFASDQMTRNLAAIFEASGDSAKAAADLVGTLTALLKEKEAMATEMVSSSIKQMMEGEIDIPAPELPAGVEMPDMEEAKKKIEALMTTVTDYALKFAVSKMDTTIVVLVAAVSAIITQIEVLFQAARGGDELAKLEKLNADGTLNDVGMAGLQDSVFAAVEAEYMTAYMMVADQVGGLVATLDKLMATDDGDGEE